MVDSDGFIYSRKKPKDTALYSAWRCRKRTPPTKCPCHAYLTLMDNSLTLGSKPHNHPADNAAPQRREVRILRDNLLHPIKLPPVDGCGELFREYLPWLSDCGQRGTCSSQVSFRVLESLFQDSKGSGVSTYLEHGGGFSPRFPNQSDRQLGTCQSRFPQGSHYKV